MNRTYSVLNGVFFFFNFGYIALVLIEALGLSIGNQLYGTNSIWKQIWLSTVIFAEHQWIHIHFGVVWLRRVSIAQNLLSIGWTIAFNLNNNNETTGFLNFSSAPENSLYSIRLRLRFTTKAIKLCTFEYRMIIDQT